jgi:hypothetical protein
MSAGEYQQALERLYGPGPSVAPTDTSGGQETATEPPEERGRFRRFFGFH